MSSTKLLDVFISKKILELEAEIKVLEGEIKKVERQLFPFEQSLRNALADLLVEERELTFLYKTQKKEKKEKRLSQKKRGKNYVASTGLKVIECKVSTSEIHQQKEKKRLYKEAMLFVHPDKYSMQENEQEKATEVTTKLIEIYKSGSFEALKAYHSHIFTGNTSLIIKRVGVRISEIAPTVYLKREIERLTIQLKNLSNSYTYKVLLEYENPLSYVNELKVYYDDRIFKLKKRTRTK